MPAHFNTELLLHRGQRISFPSVQARFLYALKVRWLKWVITLIFAALICAAVAIFAVGVFEHYKVNYETVPQFWSFAFAHAFAQMTKLCCALILLPVMRSLITWVRTTTFGQMLPTDMHVSFHKLIGRILFLAGVGHSCAWFVRTSTLGFDNTIGGFGQNGTQISDPFAEFVTGFGCLVFLAIVVFLSLDVVRRWNFEVFYYTHWFWLLYMIFMFLHGLNFWIWGTLPSLLWVIDYVWRTRRSFTPITDVECCVLPGGVVQLEFPRGDFEFKPGQYLFINCPAVSRGEWHPFTISSSPTEPYVTIHMKVLGDWTQSVQKLLSTHFSQSSPRTPSSHRVTSTAGHIFKIDGPFGAPTQDYWKFEGVVFVGMGIGNTPFVSVLRYLKERIEADMRGQIAKEPLKVRSIHFIAICQDESSLLWFSDVMHCLTSFPAGFLKIYLFLTQFQDAAQAEGSKESEVEFPRFESGIVPSLNYGRPSFDKIMRKVVKHKIAGQSVGVFFCGPRQPGHLLENACIKVTKETGVVCSFHKENF